MSDCNEVYMVVDEEALRDADIPNLYANEQDAWDSIAQDAFKSFEYDNQHMPEDEDLADADEEFQEEYLEAFSDTMEVQRIVVQ